MKRKISSRQTFFLRIILPAFFVVTITAATFSIYWQSGKSLTFLLPEMFIFLTCILLFLNIFKVVSVDDKFLYVSNYLKEISVPVSNISDVTESFLRGHPVTIHLKTPTKFGKKITFIPKTRFLFFDFTSHPIVSELKELAKINL